MLFFIVLICVYFLNCRNITTMCRLCGMIMVLRNATEDLMNSSLLIVQSSEYWLQFVLLFHIFILSYSSPNFYCSHNEMGEHTWYSSVVTRLQNGLPGNFSLIPGSSKRFFSSLKHARFFSSLKHADWVWGPRSLLFSGYWWLFPKGTAPGL